MSPKVAPTGTPENYLFTWEPRHHGLDNTEAPSLVAVLVVNGNLPTPSWMVAAQAQEETMTRDIARRGLVLARRRDAPRHGH